MSLLGCNVPVALSSSETENRFVIHSSIALRTYCTSLPNRNDDRRESDPIYPSTVTVDRLYDFQLPLTRLDSASCNIHDIAHDVVADAFRREYYPAATGCGRSFCCGRALGRLLRISGPVAKFRVSAWWWSTQKQRSTTSTPESEKRGWLKFLIRGSG